MCYGTSPLHPQQRLSMIRPRYAAGRTGISSLGPWNRPRYHAFWREKARFWAFFVRRDENENGPWAHFLFLTGENSIARPDRDAEPEVADASRPAERAARSGRGRPRL